MAVQCERSLVRSLYDGSKSIWLVGSAIIDDKIHTIWNVK